MGRAGILCLVVLACASLGVTALSLTEISRLLRPSTAPTRSTEVTSLPGYKHALPSRHFAGYIPVGDEPEGRQLYYYLVAAEQQQQRQEVSPFSGSSDLIIWLTGGPGCSSMDALAYEHGPLTFRFTPGSDAGGRSPSLSDIELSPNPFSWSKAANVLYIDSPAGTGFSYIPGATAVGSPTVTNDADDANDANDDDDDDDKRKPYHTDDDATIDDLEVFIGRFLDHYPELAEHRLIVAGESYGGIYIPLLTQRLLHHNQRLAALQTEAAAAAAATGSSPEQPQQRRYNLAGYVVGNAVTDDAFDGNGQVEFAFGAGLIDPETHDRVQSTCQGNYWNVTEQSPCSNALESMEKVMGDINQYDILNPCFFHPDTARRTLLQQQQQHMHQQQSSDASKQQQKQLRRTWPLSGIFPSRDTPIHSMHSLQKAAAAALNGGKAGGKAGAGAGPAAAMLGHTISCADRRHALLYFNDPAVRRAIHAASLEEAGRWEPCSDVLSYKHTAGSMIPVHKELVAAGVRALVLSGDADYVVPFTGSRDWVFNSLRLGQHKPWHPWKLPGDQQVAGYAVEFEQGLTFAIVKGAGHMVPQTKPRAALALLQLWMQWRL